MATATQLITRALRKINVVEETTSLTIDKRKHVSWKFSTQDLSLTIEEYSERYIKPAMIALSNKIDSELCKEGAAGFFNSVGTPGTALTTFSQVAAAAELMDEEPVPDDGQRCLVLNPNARWGLATTLAANGSSGVFNADIQAEMLRKGYLGNIANFNIYGDQNIARHTTGTHSGTPVVNGTISNGVSVLPFDGMTGSVTGALKKGDIITIAGVNSVNDVSKEDTGHLQQFLVTADVDTTTGAGNINVYPPIDDGSTANRGGLQTVTALPLDNAAITINPTTQDGTTDAAATTAFVQNLAFHRHALALVTVPLELPDSCNFKARADWRGYSLRVVKDYDIDTDEEIIRLDTLFGVKAIYPELGCRVNGA